GKALLRLPLNGFVYCALYVLLNQMMEPVPSYTLGSLPTAFKIHQIKRFGPLLPCISVKQGSLTFLYLRNEPFEQRDLLYARCYSLTEPHLVYRFPVAVDPERIP